MNKIKINIVGIKCDYCNWKDEKVKFEDYPHWLGKPCPVCGHNLLTEEDYAKAIKMMNLANFMGMDKPICGDGTKISVKLPFIHNK